MLEENPTGKRLLGRPFMIMGGCNKERFGSVRLKDINNRYWEYCRKQVCRRDALSG